MQSRSTEKLTRRGLVGSGWVVFALASACAATAAMADAVAAPRPVLITPPSSPDPAARYLFYLHGKIIEDQGRRPRHPRWGVYDYDRVLDALGADGTVVISEARPPRTGPPSYARKITGQIRRLLDAGVPPSHIGVIGFSKGGWIAHLISSQLEAPVRYVMLAMCPGPGQPRRPLHGHVLSIRERSDTTCGSCRPVFDASPAALDTRELVVDVGGGHGAFYRPAAGWLTPLLAFLHE